MAELVQIIVQALDGSELQFELLPTCTVSGLKEEIRRELANQSEAQT